MSVAPVPRRRTPVVFVAYGAAGGDWLLFLRSRCSESAPLRALIDQDIIQFWCMGAAQAPAESVRAFSDSPGVSDLSAALDRARSARATSAFPDLSVRDVRILERVSLFDPGVAACRRALKTALDRVPGVETLTTDGEQGFRYRWVALADAVHDPAALSERSREGARNALLATGDSALTFLVERLDSDVAVIDAELADRCLCELAMSFVQSDVGAPRSDDVPLSIPSVVSEVRSGHVVPFSIAVLEHSWREIETARVLAFRRLLIGGVSDKRSLDAKLGSARVLRDALQRDRVDLDANRYDRHSRRHDRQAAFQFTLAWLFAEGDIRWMRGLLVELQRDAQMLVLAGPAEVSADQPRASAGFAFSIAELSSESIGGRAYLIALGIALAAAIAALMAYRRRHISTTNGTTFPSETDSSRTISDLREDVRSEWQELIRQLGEMIDRWEIDRRSVGREQEGVPHVTLEPWLPAPPIGRRLSDSLAYSDDDIPVTPELCRDIARRCVSDLSAGDSADNAIGSACLLELRKVDDRRHAVVSAASEYLREALAPANAVALRKFVSARPYLANPSMPFQREAVVWLTAPHLQIGDELAQLEAAAARSATCVLSHDDDERSVRFSFARPVPLRAVSSLEFSQS